MTDNIITARLFIDMDGTLAARQQAACFEDLLQENYFRDLPPYQTVVDAVRILCNAHPELDIYALSAFMPENPASVEEKYGWLDVYVPEIDAAHRIFVPCGESKAAAVANRLKMPCIDKSLSFWMTTLSTCMTGRKKAAAALNCATVSMAASGPGRALP